MKSYVIQEFSQIPEIIFTKIRTKKAFQRKAFIIFIKCDTNVVKTFVLPH